MRGKWFQHFLTRRSRALLRQSALQMARKAARKKLKPHHYTKIMGRYLFGMPNCLSNNMTGRQWVTTACER